MWIKMSGDRIVFMDNEDHIKRLLNEGGQEIDDPRPQAQEPLNEQTAQEPEQKSDRIPPETNTPPSEDTNAKVSRSKSRQP